MANLIEFVSESRRRELKFVPLPQTSTYGGLCGLTIIPRDGTLEYVYFRDTGSAFHNRQIILHELAHLLADDPKDSAPGLAEELGGILPNISREGVLRILGRMGFDDSREALVESLADRLHNMVNTAMKSDDNPHLGFGAVFS